MYWMYKASDKSPSLSAQSWKIRAASTAIMGPSHADHAPDTETVQFTCPRELQSEAEAFFTGRISISLKSARSESLPTKKSRIVSAI